MKKILLVIDMQNDFISGALGSDEAERVIDNAVKVIDEFDGDVYVTLDTHDEGYMETNEGKNLPVPHCIKGTDGWMIESRIREALDRKGFTAIEKNTFASLELPKLLAERYDISDTKFELIGLCTDICIISNALLLKANFPEADISVLSFCCAGVTPKKHEAAIETMKSCQINII